MRSIAAPVASKVFRVASWEGTLQQTCTWVGWRFRARRRQIGVEGKGKERGGNWDSCPAPGASSKTSYLTFTPPPLPNNKKIVLEWQTLAIRVTVTIANIPSAARTH